MNQVSVTNPNHWRWLGLGFTLSMTLLPQLTTPAQDPEPNATEVLQSMSDYLAKTEAFSANADIDFEVVARTGQKLQFSSYASVLVEQPNSLYIKRQGPVANAEIFFDGSQLTVLGRRINAYTQQAISGTIDDAIRYQPYGNQYVVVYIN